jgi:CopG family transcriptional regulator, nickel-responsive regulator
MAKQHEGKETVRVSIAMERELLERFNRQLSRRGYGNRSEAVRDLIRASFVDQLWNENRIVVGTITLLYDHHVRELTGTLTKLQHMSAAHVLSSLHVHLDRDHCLEVIAVKGRGREIRRLAEALISTRGVLHGNLTASALGQL